jgi:hypothetical protein
MGILFNVNNLKSSGELKGEMKEGHSLSAREDGRRYRKMSSFDRREDMKRKIKGAYLYYLT